MTQPEIIGGFAFPQTDFLEDGSTTGYGEPGMTLRDYFAAKAMQGFMVGVEMPRFDNIAKVAYEMADAMLEARK
jgi:hypothetical protein